MIIGAVVAILIAPIIVGPGVLDWNKHNAALNNGEWAMYAGITAIGVVLSIVIIAGAVGVVLSGVMGGMVTFLASAIFFAGKK